MVYAIKLKKTIQRDIIDATSNEDVDMERFVAKSELKTGLKKETIVSVLINMKILNLICIEQNIIKKGKGVD